MEEREEAFHRNKDSVIENITILFTALEDCDWAISAITSFVLVYHMGRLQTLSMMYPPDHLYMVQNEMQPCRSICKRYVAHRTANFKRYQDQDNVLLWVCQEIEAICGRMPTQYQDSPPGVIVCNPQEASYFM